MSDLVSIIIPTYNREHLIGETLNSIIAQTHTNWECIVVDDGSTDNTEEVLKNYKEKDKRFIFLKRPDNLPKGANTCRNIGLNLANGIYIIFFDSDDLMLKNHISEKVNIIYNSNFDFVITETRFFNYEFGNELLEKNYNYSTDDLSLYNYVTQRINWLTLDVIIDAKLAESIRFNQDLKSGQEYNYFTKMLLKSSNGFFLKKVLTHRRKDDNSIQGKLRNNKKASVLGFFNVYWLTYLDIKNEAPIRVKQNLMYKCFKLALKHEFLKQYMTSQFYKNLMHTFGLKGVYYVLRLYI